MTYYNSVERFGRRIGDEALTWIASALEEADAIVIGAGAGLSTSAGFVYDGERFEKWFSDFSKEYGFLNMYEGGFYPYPTKEIFWAFWNAIFISIVI